ncbi:MAG TPA: hypothetical protein VMF64_05895 [Steroidobacteraceae bacterium]|nr:hypothetical protein [Steroidobacteraceae bacterium]
MFAYQRALASICLLVVETGLATAQPVPVSPPSAANAPAFAEPGVPNMLCTAPDVRQWDNCVGALTYPNGNAYRSEFHHGMRDGIGAIAIKAKGVSTRNNILSNEPSLYIGQFQGNRLNGHGVWLTASGAAYSGTFVDNIPQPDVARRNCQGPPSPAWTNCVATARYGNDNVYRGEFVRGQREGMGMIEIEATGSADDHNIRIPMPGVYIGEFSGERLNGHGLVLMSSAAFVGLFKDNLFMPSAGPGTQ